MKKDRYIFNVQTLQNTRDTDVSKAAETVQRRLKNYDYFRFNLNDSKQIKLVVAKQVPQDNNLNEIFQHPDFKDPQKKIPYAMGFDSTGTPFVDDIADFNLLMLGESNSGKSTAIRSLLTSVAYKHRSGDVNVIIMDFLGNNDSDYSMFSDQPFLSAPIIRDPLFGKRAIDILYKESKKRTSKSIPHIICVMDEFPNFFSAMTDITEKCYYKTIIEELLSGGRHSNIHMVMASQTLTKRKMVIETNNFQTRLVFRFPTAQLSESILNRRGAEKLRGKGQAIFDSRNEYDKHLQCTFMPERDMKILLKEIKETFEQKSKHRFTINMEDLDAELLYTDSDKPNTSLEYKKDDRFQSVDEVLPKAIFLALGQDKIAKQTILTTCKIGDKKALIVLEKMKQMGLVERLKANEGWKVIPRQLDNICDEALSLLEHSGYSRDTIAQRFKHEDYSNPDSKLNTSTADK